MRVPPRGILDLSDARTRLIVRTALALRRVRAETHTLPAAVVLPASVPVRSLRLRPPFRRAPELARSRDQDLRRR